MRWQGGVLMTNLLLTMLDKARSECRSSATAPTAEPAQWGNAMKQTRIPPAPFCCSLLGRRSPPMSAVSPVDAAKQGDRRCVRSMLDRG
jgi:hypothetical protein